MVFNAVVIGTVGEVDALHLVYRLEIIPKGPGETTTAIACPKELYKEHQAYCDIAVMDAGYAKASVLKSSQLDSMSRLARGRTG